MAEGLLPLSNTTCGARWLCVVKIAKGILKSLRNKLPSSCSRFFFLLTFCGFLYVRVVNYQSGVEKTEHGITAEIGHRVSGLLDLRQSY